MEWTSLNDLREQFLSFFESKQHTRLPSFPLVPIGDNSLLLINSGMAPMKKFFLGQATPPNKREKGRVCRPACPEKSDTAAIDLRSVLPG